MNKIWLVLKREYITRVRNRTFILSTILLPLVFIGFIAASIYFSVSDDEVHTIAVKDDNGLLRESHKNDKLIEFKFNDDVTSTNFSDKGYSAFLVIPKTFDSKADSISLISIKQLGFATENRIRNRINQAIKNRAFIEKNIDRKILDSINDIDEESLYKFSPVIKKGGRIEQANSGLAYGIAFGSGMLIYITLFIYGAMVMRGVMEEKMNRIAEVIISSVKPFQLMMGKILGIAAVGLTQLLIWMILIVTLSGAMSAFISPEVLQQAQDANKAMGPAANNSMALGMLNAKTTFLSANWALIIPCFLFYFVGGYLFYASLFAAVGSVVNEDPQEAQSLMLPITMPIILSMIIMINATSRPDSSIAIWASIIPFSSPIVMMARIPSGGVPWYELLASMVSLIAGFILTTMLAAKIYRTGILLYGKKVTLREMARWLGRK